MTNHNPNNHNNNNNNNNINGNNNNLGGLSAANMNANMQNAFGNNNNNNNNSIKSNILIPRNIYFLAWLLPDGLVVFSYVMNMYFESDATRCTPFVMPLMNKSRTAAFHTTNLKSIVILKNALLFAGGVVAVLI
eukprot:UN03436